MSRYEDVHSALLNWQTFSNTRSDILDVIKSGVELLGVILFEDPPLHTMHRGLMSRCSPCAEWRLLEDQIREFCVRSLDPLVGSGGFDIVAELGAVMPMRVIGMLLGIPEQDQVAVRDKTDADLRTRPGQPMREGRSRSRAATCSPTTSNGARSIPPMFHDAVAQRRVRRRTRRDQDADAPGGTTPTPVIAGAGNETTGRPI